MKTQTPINVSPSLSAPFKKIYILVPVYANEGVQNEPRGSQCLWNLRSRIPKDAAALDVSKVSLYQNLPWFSKRTEMRTVGPPWPWAPQAGVSLSRTEEGLCPSPGGPDRPAAGRSLRQRCRGLGGRTGVSLKQRAVTRETDSWFTEPVTSQPLPTRIELTDGRQHAAWPCGVCPVRCT